MSIYQFTANDITGQPVTMEEFRGKVLLIVNTATGCGFTPQYEGLEKLYETYREAGLEIVDFPCNQFGHQSPGTEEEIASFCQLNYQVSFRQFAKIEVNGANRHPLEEYVDILFLGSSVYAFGIDDAVKDFIRINAENIGLIVSFSTAAVVASAYEHVRKAASQYDVSIATQDFHCRGSFGPLHKNRPDQADLTAAAAAAMSGWCWPR